MSRVWRSAVVRLVTFTVPFYAFPPDRGWIAEHVSVGALGGSLAVFSVQGVLRWL
jgi:hypothetical protein